MMRGLVVILLAFIFLMGFTLYSLSRPGYWTTSGDPEIDKWFSDQLIPGTHQRCCSTADGQFVEEDIRVGSDGKSHYWVRWEKTVGVWLQVPDEAVINSSNKWGMPAVWWGLTDEGDEIYIKCYAPGAKT